MRGVEHETCKIPDESCEILIKAELHGIESTDHLRLDFQCECQRSTFGTVSSARSSQR